VVQSVLKKLYVAIVRPHLEYANVVWHPRFQKDKHLLEQVQHRATRLVPGFSALSYEERLRRLNLPSLSYRRLRGDMIEVYKYLNGMYNVNCLPSLSLAVTAGVQTRGHSSKLSKDRYHTATRCNFFGVRIVNRWNGLPEDVVHAPSLNSFKNRLDCHWTDLQYVEDMGT
jgi:ribonuclease P/MRP protein subunit RPP40